MTREEYQKRKAKKLCIVCSKPVAKKRRGTGLSIYCLEHLERNLQKTTAYYAAMPVEKRRARWRAATQRYKANHHEY